MHKQGTLHHKVRYAAVGKLAAFSPMTQMKTGDMDVEQLRKMASDTRAQASNDGRLAKALLLKRAANWTRSISASWLRYTGTG